MLDSLLQFVKFTHQFQQIRRKVLVNGEERSENDSEHSYQLAMLAWYIIERDSLALDSCLAMQYALVHDLVEVYAGDTFILAEASEIESKKEREAAAAQQIKAEFADFNSLHELIHQYEEKSTPEARFVYVLDKLLPMFNIYLDNGRSWNQYDINIKDIIGMNRQKVTLSPELEPYFEELVAVLLKNKL